MSFCTRAPIALLWMALLLAACQSPAAPTLVAPAATPAAPEPSPSLTAASVAAATSLPTAVSASAVPPSPTATTVTGSAMSQLETHEDTVRAHVVAEGEDNVGVIAPQYDVTVEQVLAANGMLEEDIIHPGDTLLIPIAGAAVTPTSNPRGDATAGAPTSQATETAPAPTLPAGPSAWGPSRTDGDPQNYPLTRSSPSGGLLIHYQPGTYPEANMDTLAPMLDQILFELAQRMGGSLQQQVDIFLAGTLFGDDPGLQGLSVSRNYRTSVLVNGAFHPGEEHYILGHELTHVAATNILGPASSTMIHEGLATYLPQKYLQQEAGYLPIYEICAAIQQTDAFVPARTLIQYGYGVNGYGGHIRTFFHYNLAGCFTGYLVERFGMEQMDVLYDSGDYRGVYGMSLAELDDAWQTWMVNNVDVTVNAQDFVRTVEAVAQAYNTYLAASSGGYHYNYEAYLELNRARLAANQGNLQQAEARLDRFWQLFNS